MQLSELWSRGWEFPVSYESAHNARFRGQPAMKNQGSYFLPFTPWPSRIAHVPSLAGLVKSEARKAGDGTLHFPVVVQN